MFAFVLAGCTPEGSGKGDADPTTAEHTGVTTDDTDSTPITTETDTTPEHTGTFTDPADVACAPTLNPQVFRCTVTLPAPGPATLRFSAAGADTRTFTDDAEVAVHELVGWGLLPGITYDVSAAGGSTTVTTGALPPALAAATFDVSGTLFGIDAVLIYVKCGYFVMVDGEGRIVWYLETELYDGFTDGMRWSQADRSVLALKDSAMTFGESAVAEIDVEWTEQLRLNTGDFSLRLTHDADKWRGYTYLLGENGQRMGGFEVFDGTTHLGTWMLDDSFSGVPGLANAHVNGLTVSETGEVVISALNLDAVFAVDGDPASPTFLQLLWHAAGSAGASDLPNPDYAPTSGSVFRAQHNGSRVGDELWVFDNGSERTARAVRLQMDLVTGALTELDSWSTNTTCRNQGGALPVPGGALVTCANSDEVALFRDATATPDWQLQGQCGSARIGGASTRAYPVTIE
jgi:hypothetical protein